MPKHYFNIRNATSRFDDNIGEELPDDTAAWKEATLVAGEQLKDIDGRFQPGQEWNLEVTDQRHHPLYSIAICAKKLK
jgi:hypothetical protein